MKLHRPLSRYTIPLLLLNELRAIVTLGMIYLHFHGRLF